MTPSCPQVEFQVLATHGVGMDDIDVLENAFGYTFANDVDGPEDVISWIFARLPWPRQRDLLREWQLRLFACAGIDVAHDRQAARVIELLASPTNAGAQRLGREISELVIQLEHDRGVDVSAVAEPDADLCAWIAACALIAAADSEATARKACRHPAFGEDGTIPEVAQAVFSWLIAQVESSPSQDVLRTRTSDACVREATRALTSYVRRWSPWACA